jgi:L-threonylcarbamoyladenylate synthase
MIDEQRLDKAVRILREGGLVAFPTETVYGLGADAANPEAVRKIFAAKGRPADHPVIVHLPDVSHLACWAKSVPNSATCLAARFWPGPLTLILPRAASVHDVVTGEQDTVGLRVPNHPLALELLRRFGGGVAAPSANRFGRLSPTTAKHVTAELGDRVDLVLDGGACAVGIESTIVDLSGAQPALLRPGKISHEQIEQTLGAPVALSQPGSPRAPGTLDSHYAPRTPLKLLSRDAIDTGLRAMQPGKIAVLARRPSPRFVKRMVWMKAPADAQSYAQSLYANVRKLDDSGCEAIWVEQVPEGGQWAAIRDRLARAAQTWGGEHET